MKTKILIALLLFSSLCFAQRKMYTVVNGGLVEVFPSTGSSGTDSPAKTYTDITSDNQTLSILDANNQVFNISDDYTTIIPDNFPVGRSIRIDASLFSADSTTIVRETNTTKFWIDLETLVVPTDEAEGFKLAKGRSAIAEKVNATTVKIFGADISAYYNDIFPDLAGSFTYPNSTNLNWTDPVDATLSVVVGPPNELQYVSLNNSGADFITQNLITTPVALDTYRITAEAFYQSGAFFHVQLRQVGGVSQRFEASTVGGQWEQVDFTLQLANTDQFVLDIASDGSGKVRNIRVFKQ